MATIKSFTSLEQSRKLAEILPLKSADMYIGNFVGESGKVDGTNVHYYPRGESFGAPEIIYAWSLAALYNILPNTEHISTTLSRGGWKIEQTEYVDKWWCGYEDDNDHTRDVTVTADNPVDACVAMIEKLHKLKML